MIPLIFSLACFLSFSLFATKIEYIKDDTGYNHQIQLTLPLEKDDLFYHEYLSLHIDDENIELDAIAVHNKTFDTFDPTFNTYKKVSSGPIEITANLRGYNPELHANKHATVDFSYYTKKQNDFIHEALIVTFPDTDELQTHVDVESSLEPQEKCEIQHQKEQSNKWTWSGYISGMLTATESTFIRFLLVFLIGILMSLTPCIYPMIPITVGILQAQGSKSLGRNFLLSLSYTLGLATTFAILGLLAAFAGQAMGNIMSKPYFIIPVVLLLMYLAGVMLDLYPMYTPRFMQQSSQVKGGSFITAYMCGAASGTIASPCLSPGLILLLCIVTTLGSKILGFLLLFSFGIGLGVPLLIIGTFSSSLAILPQAGVWMIEIKKIFGLLLVGTCWYFLANILPWHIVMILITLSTFMLGLIFLYNTKKMPQGIWKTINTFLGMMLIGSTVFFTLKTYQAFLLKSSCEQENGVWITDYECARQKALEQNRLLFIDIGGPFCSICKALDNTLFKNENVLTVLKEIVAVKLDGSHDKNQNILQQHSVIGFPTLLLLDPKNESVVKKWGPELYGSDPEDFKKELQRAIAAF